MPKSLLIYAIPAALVFAPPFLPDSGKDSPDVAFTQNLGPNVLPIAFWVTAIIFVTRLAISLAPRGNGSARGFEPLPRPAISTAGQPQKPSEEPRHAVP